MLKFLASFVTLTAVLMTSVAAWDRGGTILDKALLVSMSVVIVLAVHLLPSISKRPAAWLVWSFCLLCAVYGHLTFLIHSNERAIHVQAEHSTTTNGLQKQSNLVRESLSRITARTSAEVAAELARTTDKRTRAALNIELSESRKATQLFDDLRKLESREYESKTDGATDSVTLILSSLFGVEQGSIAVVIGLTFALLVELIGTLLWLEVMCPSHVTQPVTHTSHAITPSTTRSESHVTQHMTQGQNHNAALLESHAEPSSETGSKIDTHPASISARSRTETSPESDEVSALKSAIESGQIKPTVNAIREFIGCGQKRAIELRRMLSA